MKYLVTGGAGFIGAASVSRLLKEGHQVIVIDNLSNYYDVALKQSRLHQFSNNKQFAFHQIDIADKSAVDELFDSQQIDIVIHLAAQAGVRHSMNAPMDYAHSNLVGHLVILEACRQHSIKHLVYASSSSVYGMSDKMPLSCDDRTDHPVSLYAATKKSNELMSHSYSHLYNLPTTGLRFFTVYGPWGRPDMAPFKFTEKIMAGDPIDIYNNGDLSRDFTYIDDIVEGVLRISTKPPKTESDVAGTADAKQSSSASAPYQLFNIGCGSPVRLLDFVQCLEKAIGKKANLNMLPMQPGDVYQTWADTEDLFNAINYRPKVSLEEGIPEFVAWYRKHYSC